MYVVTNRNIVDGAEGFGQLGPLVNPAGPAELRLAEVNRKRGGWEVTILPDRITAAMKQEAGITEAGDVFASAYVFRRLMTAANPRLGNPRSKAKGKDILLYVHGFNNSFKDVVERCFAISDNFPGLEVVAFTWPANGGGVKGVADYLDDKRDAQASVVAFDRVLAKIHDYLQLARQSMLEDLKREAQERFPDSSEQQQQFVARAADKHCPFKVSMLLHSMGNYLFERTLKSEALRGDRLVFDNIVMAAADVNNPRHIEWVDRIQVRNRLYVTINEDDGALQASRMKGGDEQLARLGHYPYDLTARHVVYVDFTNVPSVAASHAYFEGDALRNPNVKRFFERALHGLRVEDDDLLAYDASCNLHRLA